MYLLERYLLGPAFGKVSERSSNLQIESSGSSSPSWGGGGTCYDLDEGVGQVSDNWSTLGRSMVNDAMIT